MKRIFVYDGVADHPLYMDGYRAASIGYIKGAKLMFASKRIGGLVEGTIYCDDTTEEDKIYGTLWEVSDKTYDWLVNDLYSDFRVFYDITFVANNGEEYKCDTYYLPKGVFSIPNETEITGIRNFYKYYNIDEKYIEKAIDDCEKEVCEGGNA